MLLSKPTDLLTYQNLGGESTVLLQDSSIADLKISGTLPTNNEESFFKALAVILDLEITRGNNKEVIFKRTRFR